MNIQIKRITEMEQIYPILDLMQRVWQEPDRELVSSYEMKAVTEFGVVLGAYDTDLDESKPIGFIYAFPKFPDIHYSHMMGIDPTYQGKNVGFLLKLFHRKIALESTNPVINAIEWTVDPLLSINANINFRKLGVVCNEFHENFYGTFTQIGIYPSLPTDRILVRWLIRSSRVEKRLTEKTEIGLGLKIRSQSIDKNGLLKTPEMIDFEKVKSEDSITLEIPDKFTELSRTNYDWALDWRLKSRAFFKDCFKHGYYLIDFQSFKITPDSKRYFYVLSKDKNYYD